MHPNEIAPAKLHENCVCAMQTMPYLLRSTVFAFFITEFMFVLYSYYYTRTVTCIKSCLHVRYEYYTCIVRACKLTLYKVCKLTCTILILY